MSHIGYGSPALLHPDEERLTVVYACGAVAAVDEVVGRRTVAWASVRGECPWTVTDTWVVSDTSSGVAIVVWRRAPTLEVLLLHRSQFGRNFEGDWAWATPGGGRQAGEPSAATAARELFEETGLSLRCVRVESRVASEQPGIDVGVFAAEASGDDPVCLSSEHDRYEWVQLAELRRVEPKWVCEMYHEVLEAIGIA